MRWSALGAAGVGMHTDAQILHYFSNLSLYAAQTHSEISLSPVCLGYLKNLIKILLFSPMLHCCPTQETQPLHSLQAKRSYSAPNFAKNLLCDLKQNNFLHMLQPELVIRREKDLFMARTAFRTIPEPQVGPWMVSSQK